MLKKGIAIVLALIMVLGTCGCDSGEHIALTQEESDAIAQYSAFLLLKYDQRKTHKEKLLDEKQLKEVYAERAAEEEKNNPVTPQPTPSPVPEKAGETDEQGSAPKQESGSDVTPTPDASPRFDSLGECYDGKFDVAYLESFVGASYKGENETLAINAKDGQKLVIVEIAITNGSSQEQTFRTKDYNVSYKLVGDIKTYKPELSLIANDLSLNYEKKLAPGESTSGILLFIIDSKESAKKVVVTNPDVSSDKIYEITINN